MKILKLCALLLALTSVSQGAQGPSGFETSEELHGFQTRTGTLNRYQREIYDDALRFADPGRAYQEIYAKGHEVAVAGLLEVFPRCHIYGCADVLLESVPFLDQDLGDQLPAITEFVRTKLAEQDFIRSSVYSSPETSRMFWTLCASRLGWLHLHVRWKYARYHYELNQLGIPAEECFQYFSPKVEVSPEADE